MGKFFLSFLCYHVDIKYEYLYLMRSRQIIQSNWMFLVYPSYASMKGLYFFTDGYSISIGAAYGISYVALYSTLIIEIHH